MGFAGAAPRLCRAGSIHLSFRQLSKRKDSDVPPPGDARKLAAILAADMVGYSRLMAADEAGTIARLKTYRPRFNQVTPDPATGDWRAWESLLGDTGKLLAIYAVLFAAGAAA